MKYFFIVSSLNIEYVAYFRMSYVASVTKQFFFVFVFQGLVQSKQIRKTSSLSHDKDASVNATENACLTEDSEEMCPVCQEKLSNRKMVFQCGHITCCKCEFLIFRITL